MYITLYNLAKARNSTKTPTESNVLKAVTATYKSPTSIVNPTFDIAITETMPDYCSSNGRYYFIDDVEYITSNIMRLHCRVDVLATLKSQILNSDQYVARSQSMYDYALSDSENRPTNTISHKTTITAMPINFDASRTGCCIIGIGASSVGATGEADRGTAIYYALNGTNLVALSQAMSNGSVLEDLAKQFNGGMNGIITAMYLNVPLSEIPTIGNGAITIGNWNSGVSAAVINQRLLTGNTNVYFNQYYGDPDCYLNHPPYTSVYTYLPYVGVVPVDTDIHGSAFKITAYLDILTGTITYKLSSMASDATNMPMSVYRGKCGVDIPLQYGSRNVLGMLSGAVTTFASIAGGNYAGIAGGALQTAAAASLNTQVLGDVGDIGSVLLGDKFIYTHTITKRPAHSVDGVISRVGAPWERVERLSNLSGYCQCRNAKLDVTELRQIVDMAETILNTGFYIE